MYPNMFRICLESVIRKRNGRSQEIALLTIVALLYATRQKLSTNKPKKSARVICLEYVIRKRNGHSQEIAV